MHGNASKADSLDDQSLEKLKYNLNVNSLSTILIISSLLESMIAQKFEELYLWIRLVHRMEAGKTALVMV